MKKKPLYFFPLSRASSCAGWGKKELKRAAIIRTKEESAFRCRNKKETRGGTFLAKEKAREGKLGELRPKKEGGERKMTPPHTWARVGDVISCFAKRGKGELTF